MAHLDEAAVLQPEGLLDVLVGGAVDHHEVAAPLRPAEEGGEVVDVDGRQLGFRFERFFGVLVAEGNGEVLQVAEEACDGMTALPVDPYPLAGSRQGDFFFRHVGQDFQIALLPHVAELRGMPVRCLQAQGLDEFPVPFYQQCECL